MSNRSRSSSDSSSDNSSSSNTSSSSSDSSDDQSTKTLIPKSITTKDEIKTIDEMINIPLVDGDEKKKKPFWSQKPIIYLKGLPFTATVPEIRNFLCDCGEIKSITQQLNDKNRWIGAVFVKFDSMDSVKNAIALDGTVWSGEGGDGVRFVKIEEREQKKAKKNKRKDQMSTVFIGNLDANVTEALIRESFEQRVGSIKSIRLAKEEKGEKCRGFGHIEFNTVRDKDYALSQNGKIKINEQVIKIRIPSDLADTNKRKTSTTNKNGKRARGNEKREKKIRLPKENNNNNNDKDSNKVSSNKDSNDNSNKKKPKRNKCNILPGNTLSK